MIRKDKIEKLEAAIHTIRGQRVMLDSELAEIYQVTTKRLNEQLRRNRARFPEDFAFQLTAEEFTNLRSQIATSTTGLRSQNATLKPLRGKHRKYNPWVFTEHGAIMLASVLNSEVAVEASVRVVRAFIRLREMVLGNAELSRRVDDLESRVGSHDAAIAQLFAAIRQSLSPPAEKKKRQIGFHVRERNGIYRVRRRMSNQQSAISN